jgi:hypothetical protein
VLEGGARAAVEMGKFDSAGPKLEEALDANESLSDAGAWMQWLIQITFLCRLRWMRSRSKSGHRDKL